MCVSAHCGSNIHRSSSASSSPPDCVASPSSQFSDHLGQAKPSRRPVLAVREVDVRRDRPQPAAMNKSSTLRKGRISCFENSALTTTTTTTPTPPPTTQERTGAVKPRPAAPPRRHGLRTPPPAFRSKKGTIFERESLLSFFDLLLYVERVGVGWSTSIVSGCLKDAVSEQESSSVFPCGAVLLRLRSYRRAVPPARGERREAREHQRACGRCRTAAPQGKAAGFLASKTVAFSDGGSVQLRQALPSALAAAAIGATRGPWR